MMSIIQVFLKGRSHYYVNNAVVVYFCFPTIGVAVPLRPGDYLLFNPILPHCILFWCKLQDEVISISTYLKTAIIGMNNNNLPLNPKQLRVTIKIKVLFTRPDLNLNLFWNISSLTIWSPRLNCRFWFSGKNLCSCLIFF